MIEVFKTNVKTREQAEMLIGLIHLTFDNYWANFDLADCDKVLRVESTSNHIDSPSLINLVKYFGHQIDVLPDEIPSVGAGKFDQLRNTSEEFPIYRIENLS